MVGGGLWPVGIQPGRSACALWRRNGLAVNRECLQLVRCRQYPIPRGRLKHGSEAWGQGLLPRKEIKKDMETKGRKEKNHQCSRATTRLARAVRRDHGTLLRSLLLVLVLVLRWDPIMSDDTQCRARIVGSENVVHRRLRPFFIHSSTPMSMQTLTWEIQVSTTSRIRCDTDETRGLGATDNRPGLLLGLVHSSFQNSLAERSRTYVIDLRRQGPISSRHRHSVCGPWLARGTGLETGRSNIWNIR